MCIRDRSFPKFVDRIILFLFPFREITQDPSATPSEDQIKFLEDITKTDDKGDNLYNHFFIFGVSGSGKTICAVELLKQRVAQLKMKYPDEKIEVHVDAYDAKLLIEDFKGKYLKELKSWLDEDIGYNNRQYGIDICLLYTSPSPRDRTRSRMPSSA